MNELITQLFEHPIDQSMTQPVTGANHENSPVINQTASDRNQQEHRKRKSQTTLTTAHHYLWAKAEASSTVKQQAQKKIGMNVRHCKSEALLTSCAANFQMIALGSARPPILLVGFCWLTTYPPPLIANQLQSSCKPVAFPVANPVAKGLYEGFRASR